MPLRFATTNVVLLQDTILNVPLFTEFVNPAITAEYPAGYGVAKVPVYVVLPPDALLAADNTLDVLGLTVVLVPVVVQTWKLLF